MKKVMHYDSTKKERNKKNIRLADQLHFIRWNQLLKSRTLVKAPYEYFVDASLLFFLFLYFLVGS